MYLVICGFSIKWGFRLLWLLRDQLDLQKFLMVLGSSKKLEQVGSLQLLVRNHQLRQTEKLVLLYFLSAKSVYKQR